MLGAVIAVSLPSVVDAVTQAFTADAPPYDGIVPLHMQSDLDFEFDNYFGDDGNNPVGHTNTNTSLLQLSNWQLVFYNIKDIY